MTKAQPTTAAYRPRCPTCDLLVDTGRVQYLPFCSDRCRLIDLGRWLNEEIALPCEASEGEVEQVGEPSDRPRLPPGWHDA